MTQVNIFQAKSDLSKLISSIEKKEQDYIVIARNGKPVAKIIPFEPEKKKSRIGVAKGKLDVISIEELDKYNDEIAELFGV